MDAGTSGAEAHVRTDGRPVFYSGAGILAKLHRLRRRSEHLHTQIAALDALLAGIPVPKKLPEDLLSRRNLRLAELAAV